MTDLNPTGCCNVGNRQDRSTFSKDHPQEAGGMEDAKHVLMIFQTCRASVCCVARPFTLLLKSLTGMSGRLLEICCWHHLMTAEILLRNDGHLFANGQYLDMRIRSLFVRCRLQVVRGVLPNRLCLSLSATMPVCTWYEGHEGEELPASKRTGCHVEIKSKE